MAGFLIGIKSILNPVSNVAWMGKTGNTQTRRIQPTPVTVADCVVSWPHLAVAPFTRVAWWRLLGRLAWLGRPGHMVAAFWSGARLVALWAQVDSPSNLVNGVLEGLFCALREWEPWYSQHDLT